MPETAYLAKNTQKAILSWNENGIKTDYWNSIKRNCSFYERCFAAKAL